MENITPVIIPAYEPDEKLTGLVKELSGCGMEPIIIVDDGSDEDKYGHIFSAAHEEYGAVILRHAVNLGKGRALKDAFNYCLNEYPDMTGCVTADCDGQHTPVDIIRCREELIAHPKELIMGCRDFAASDIPGRSLFGNRVTGKVMSFLAGVKVSDTQTGLRAVPKRFMAKLLTEKGERYEFETNMLLRTRQEKIPIREVAIQTIYIEDNKTSHFRPVRDSIMIYALFVKFLLSSLSSSIIDMALFALFCGIFRGADTPFAGYIMLSTILARVISAVYNFIINYQVVFNGTGSKKRAAVRYIILAVIIMILSGTLVSFFCRLLPAAPEVVLKIPVDCLLFLLSFYVQREVVYSNEN